MYTKRFNDHASKQAPGWALGTALVAATTVTGTVLLMGGGDGGGAQIQPAAAESAITGTVAVDGLNVRALESDSPEVDLSGEPVVKLPNGTSVAVTCEFTGTEVPGEGSRWYRITVSGHTGELVAFAPYITVPVAVPGCVTGEREPTPPIVDTSKLYVAMGDSFGAGEGAKDYLPGTEGFGKCHRSRNAYAMLFARLRPHLSGDNMAFVACSGAVTGNITDVGQHNEPPQIGPGVGLGKRTQLVTISVGVNDIGFAKVLLTCYLSLHGCADAERGVEDKLRTLPAKLANTYAAIKQQAPNARLAVLTYPKIFMDHPSGSTCLEEFRMGEHFEWLSRTTKRLNDTIETEARNAGATVVDVEDILHGSELCTGERTKVVHAQDGPDFHEWFHPTAEGNQDIADLVHAKV